MTTRRRYHIAAVDTLFQSKLHLSKLLGASVQFLALSCARPVSHESYSFCLRVSAPGIITGKRPRRRWEDNITIHLEEIGINAGNWLDSAQDR